MQLSSFTCSKVEKKNKSLVVVTVTTHLYDCVSEQPSRRSAKRKVKLKTQVNSAETNGQQNAACFQVSC